VVQKIVGGVASGGQAAQGVAAGQGSGRGVEMAYDMISPLTVLLT